MKHGIRLGNPSNPMIIGIDASRANKKQRTGTEWYSYFLIEEFKKITDLSFLRKQESDKEDGNPLPSGRGEGEVVDVGSTEDIRNLTPTLSEDGEGDLRFVLYSRDPLDGDLANLPKKFKSQILRWPFRFFWTQIRLAWEMLSNPPDLLFVPAHALPIVSRAKMAVTIHDVGFRVEPHLYSRKDIWYHRFSTWLASHFASWIICPSEFTKSELLKYYPGARGKVHVIPHGISPAEPSQKIEVDHPYFLYIGRLEEKKNIFNIVKAFELFQKAHPRYRLQLTGPPGHGFSRVQDYIKAHSLNDKIRFTGYVPESRKRQLYSSAAALVFPSLYEGFGLPILEAQVYGCPVITSGTGACREVAGDAALFVDPGSPESTSQAMEALASSPEVRRQLGQKGEENSRRFTWRKAALATLKILAS